VGAVSGLHHPSMVTFLAICCIHRDTIIAPGGILFAHADYEPLDPRIDSRSARAST
jgi:hypothetical protein